MNRGQGRGRSRGSHGGRGAGGGVEKPLLRAHNPMWIWLQF
jgi:hypothetical protein